MGRTGLVRQEANLRSPEGPWPKPQLRDVRWEAAELAAASAHISRSLLLSRFLLYIVAESIEGRADRITEHQIGVKVFGRPATYRTVEDNIVRNYARQLRKRLAEYYESDGRADALRIEIPVGGYVPAFHARTDAKTNTPARSHEVPDAEVLQEDHLEPRSWLSRSSKLLRAALLCAIYTAAVARMSWIASVRAHGTHLPPSATDALWQSLLDSPNPAYIVPSDAGFNLLEDLSRQHMSLADYLKSTYLNLPLRSIGAHTAADLRSQEYTSFVDLQAIAAVARLPKFRSESDVVRFPRSLRLDDLKDANAILLGSEDSNPWTGLAETNANFRIRDDQDMRGAILENRRPRPGEQALYQSHWDEPAHETFALIQYLPNLSGTGHVLLLQGLDVAGTEAAIETILHPAAIATILARAKKPDGQLRPFEILLRSSSIVSNAAETEVIASRID